MKRSFSLENFIYLIVFLLPAYLLRFGFFGVRTNLLEVLILFSFLWLAIKMMVEMPISEARTRFKAAILNNKQICLSAGLIVVGLIASAFMSDNPFVGLGIIKGWFIFPFMLLAVILIYFDKKRAVNIFKALFFSSFLVATISLVYLLSSQLTYDGRLKAFFNSPNYLAMYLVPGAIIGSIVLFWIEKEKIKSRIIYSASLLIITAALYFTYSYAAWLSLLIALGAVFLSQKKLDKKKLLVFGLAVVALWLLARNTDKFHDLSSFSDRSSLQSRMMIWRSAGRMLQDDWLLGIGPGMFQEKYLENQKYYLPYLEWAVPHPHNVYLAFWLYGGTAGISGFLLLLFFWWKETMRRSNDPLRLIALGIMVSILAHGFFDTTYFKNDLAIIFWLNFLIFKR